MFGATKNRAKAAQEHVLTTANDVRRTEEVLPVASPVKTKVCSVMQDHCESNRISVSCRGRHRRGRTTVIQVIVSTMCNRRYSYLIKEMSSLR